MTNEVKKMPSIEEVLSAVEYLKKWEGSVFSFSAKGEKQHHMEILLSLAESHLSSGVEGVEKKENTPNYDYENGWNACCDAVRLAGWRRVPSVKAVEEIIRECEEARFEQRNLGLKPMSITQLARAVVEKMEGEK